MVDRCNRISVLRDTAKIENRTIFTPLRPKAAGHRTRMTELSGDDKNFDNMFSRFDTISACDGRTAGVK